MMIMKHLSILRLGVVALMTAALAACGGSDNNNSSIGGGGAVVGGGTGTVNLSAPTSGNPNNAFTALTGIPLVTSASPTKVNFTVVGSNNQPVQGLTLFNAAGAGTGCSTYNTRFAIAKLVKGNGTSPDTWQNLVSQVRSSGNPKGYVEGTTDPVPSASVAAGTAGAGSLTYNAAGYYTYTFGTDLANAAYVAGPAVSTNKIFTNGNTLAKDGTTTYRVGMQLCYVDTDGKTVIVNPIYDFTMGSDGNSATAAVMRKVVSKDSCNECHGTLDMHGGRRVDPNYCVLCHNPGSVDYHDNDLAALGYPDGGAPIDLKYMIHKLHFGERLSKDYKVVDVVARFDTKVAVGPGGVRGTIVNGTQYPQDQTNCTKCHDNSKAANADNWKKVPSRNACGACHDGINFATGGGTTMDGNAGGKSGHVGGAQADDTFCALCHSPTAISSVYHVPVTAIVSGTNVTTHYVSSANVSRMPAGAVTVNYEIKSVSLNGSRNPVMEFRILQSGVRTDLRVASGTTDTAMWPNFFGAPSVYFAYAVPQDLETKPFDFNTYVTASLQGIWNKSATGTSAGTLSGPDANGFYTVTLTGRVIPTTANMLTGALGYAAMYQTNVAGYERTCPVTSPANCSNGLNVPAQDVSLVATGFDARRITVEATRCNACHEKLGIFGDTVFHSGQRNDPKMCAMCHNPNRSSSGWSADSTAFVHGIHGGQKRTVKYNWHASTDVGGDGITPIRVSDFSTILMPGGKTRLKNCVTCHAPGGYNFDSSSGLAQVAGRLYRVAATGPMAATGTSGALSASPYVTLGATYGNGVNSSDPASATCNTSSIPCDPANTLVNSPIANACFACHDGELATMPGTSVKSHIELTGGGSIYRTRGVAGTTDLNLALGRAEQCLACHGTTGIVPIKAAHGVQ